MHRGRSRYPKLQVSHCHPIHLLDITAPKAVPAVVTPSCSGSDGGHRNARLFMLSSSRQGTQGHNRPAVFAVHTCLGNDHAPPGTQGWGMPNVLTLQSLGQGTRSMRLGPRHCSEAQPELKEALHMRLRAACHSLLTVLAHRALTAFSRV